MNPRIFELMLFGIFLAMLRLPSDEAVSLRFAARLAKPQLAGAVLDPNGNAVAGARLELRRHQPGEVDPARPRSGATRAMSGADGTFELSGMKPGAYRLRVSHDDFEPLTEFVELEAGVPNDVEVFFQAYLRRLEIHGRVEDEDGRAVNGVELRLFAGRVPQDRTTSADGGEFHLEVPRLGGIQEGEHSPYNVRAEHPGFAVLDTPIEVDEDVDLVLELARGAVAEGRLLGLDDDEMAAVRVLARASETTRYGKVEDGTYRIAGLAAGDWRVAAWVHGAGHRGTSRVLRTPGHGVEVLDLEFPPGYRLNGQVLLDGRPLAAAEVLLGCRRVGTVRRSTGDDGTVVFSGVPAGSCVMSVKSPALGATRSESLEVHGDDDVVVELYSTTLTGVVTGAAGSVAGATVELLERYSRDVHERVTSDGRGRFALSSAVEGAALLRASAPGHAPLERWVALERGSNDIELTLDAAGSAVLEVLLAGGVPPRRVTVSPARREGRRYARFRRVFEPDRNGRIVVDGLAHGLWELHLQSDDGHAGTIEIEVPGALGRIVLGYGNSS